MITAIELSIVDPLEGEHHVAIVMPLRVARALCAVGHRIGGVGPLRMQVEGALRAAEYAKLVDKPSSTDYIEGGSSGLKIRGEYPRT